MSAIKVQLPSRISQVSPSVMVAFEMPVPWPKAGRWASALETRAKEDLIFSFACIAAYLQKVTTNLEVPAGLMARQMTGYG
jgi:hypothetical protein